MKEAKVLCRVEGNLRSLVLKLWPKYHWWYARLLEWYVEETLKYIYFFN